jgi:NAD(P)-dependent dehydrogenase (short-subunit alcohol dehydrogenase family)
MAGVLDGFKLDGMVAVVIGAGTHAGRAVAVALAEAGADLALTTMSESDEDDYAVNSTANEVWAIGRKNLPLKIDCTDPTALNALCEQVVDELGRVDILVNAQDRPLAVPFDEAAQDEIELTIALNQEAVLLACQSAGRYFMRQGSGAILNVVFEPPAGRPLVAYATAKAAVLGLTRALADEWSGAGLRVNAVAVPADQPDLQALAAAAVFLTARGTRLTGCLLEL